MTDAKATLCERAALYRTPLYTATETRDLETNYISKVNLKQQSEFYMM